MIKAIGVTNHLNQSLTLELGFPERSGLLVQEIGGLGPSKANINAIEMSTNDGSMYTSARLNARNITLRLKFLAKPTIEDARQLSYKYFPIKKQVRLFIETDNRTCEIYGYVESNEPDIFSNQSGTVISIMCPDPYFYSLKTMATEYSGITPNFEFEFSNESLSEKLIEPGSITTVTMQNIYYPFHKDNYLKDY